MNYHDKYAQIERERKFLLKRLPDLITSKTPKKLIQDHYVINTNLRLRQVSSPEGIIYKLTKKYPLQAESLSEFKIINIYLEEKEFLNLLSLPSYQLHKTRYILKPQDDVICIDRIILNLQEILIAEVEFKDVNTMNSFQLPFPFAREVTAERDYTGFEIAKQMWTSMNH